MNYYLLVIVWPSKNEYHLLKADNAGQAEDKAEYYFNNLKTFGNPIKWYFQQIIE
jgi:hypothetical protein